MDKNEVVEHIVVVDEYISAILKIPKELSALDLKALMVKSNKLLNLAEVRIYDGPGRPTQKYDTSKKFTIDERTSAVKTWFTGNGTIKEELAKTLDMKRNVLARKVSYWRHRHNIDISGLTLNTNERGRKIKPLKKKNSGDWTTYEVKKLKELYNKHTITELTEIFGRTKIAIYDKASLEGLTIILKQQKQGKKRAKANKWTDKMNTKFIKMVKDKKSILQISKRFNITRKMSYDKIYRLKREGKI